MKNITALLSSFSREELLVLLYALERIKAIRERDERLKKLVGSLPAPPSLN